MKRVLTPLGLTIAMALSVACTSSTPPSSIGTPTASTTAGRTPSRGPTSAGTATELADVTTAPVAFTGVIICGPAVRRETSSITATGDGVTVTRKRLGAWQQTVNMTDPRLVGTTYHTYETDSYGPAGAAGASISAATRRIENDGGAWTGSWFEATGGDGKPIGDTPFVLVGEGGYGGLVAIYRITGTVPPCNQEVSGFIFSGMSDPTPWTAE